MGRKLIIFGIAGLFALGAVLLSFIGYPGKASHTDEAATQAVDDAFKHGVPADPVPELDTKNIPVVIAVVNGTEIDGINYLRAIKAVKMQLARHGGSLDGDRLAELKKNIIDNIVNTELLFQEAKAKNVKVDENRVMAQYNGLMSRYNSEEEFVKSLAREHFTVEQLKAEIRKGQMIGAMLEKELFKNIKIADEQAREYFEKNKDKYKRPDMVKARHILIKLEPDASSDKVADVNKRIREIEKKIAEGGSFEELAKKFSEGPSAPRGGDLGLFPRGVMVKEFEDVAFSLKPGEVSKPVRTQFGLHLIKVEEIQEAGVPDFEKVKKSIAQNIENDERKKLVEQYIEGLKNKSEIKVLL